MSNLGIRINWSNATGEAKLNVQSRKRMELMLEAHAKEYDVDLGDFLSDCEHIVRELKKAYSAKKPLESGAMDL